MTHFPDRKKRFDDLLSDITVSQRLPLFCETPIKDFSLLKDCCVNYVLKSLLSIGKTYKFSHDILSDYPEDIKSLPNLTPNGLLLPKKDNLKEYNQLHNRVGKIFSSFNLDKYVKSVHVPINIRIIDGIKTERDDRPRSSSKLHSDIWAGEFSNTIMLFYTALGDIDNNGIEFYEPDKTFFEFCKPLPDYLDGSGLEKTSTKYDCKLKSGYAYFTDPFLLHRTQKKCPGLRLSIDFRFISFINCETDKYIETNRHDNYIDLEKWYEIGEKSMLYTDMTIAESKSEETGPQNAYAAKYILKEIKCEPTKD